MLVTNYATIRPNELGTRTVEDFSKFLGSKPHRLGIVARQNPDLTTSFLTESLMNIYDVESKNKYQPISSFLIEWEVEQSFIKRESFQSRGLANGQRFLRALAFDPPRPQRHHRPHAVARGAVHQHRRGTQFQQRP